MMARTKPIRRSYAAGEWGRNRVRVFPDPKTGLFQIEWRDNGRRLTRSLKHRDWRRAKRQADEFAAGFAGPEIEGKAEAESEPLTLETLFDIYGEEVTPAKVERVRHRDRTATRMFLDFLGRDRRPETLSQRDWDRFIRARRAGRVGASGSPVSDRTIEYDLKFLIAVFNWAAKSRDEQGRPLLEANPLRGLKTPKEKNPTRVVLSDEEYRALLQVSRRVDWRFQVALVLAHETLAALEEARQINPGNGDAPVLPASWDPSTSFSRARAYIWWNRAERLAGLKRMRVRGWHSLRRKFASDLMDLPLKVLCELGGWKEAQTVLRCYQQADEVQLRKALESRHKVRA